jgi:hypothetical protein
MNEEQIQQQATMDATEALSKYGGTLEVRRPGHPLFGKKTVVTRSISSMTPRWHFGEVRKLIVRTWIVSNLRSTSMAPDEWNKSDIFALELIHQTIRSTTAPKAWTGCSMSSSLLMTNYDPIPCASSSGA